MCNLFVIHATQMTQQSFSSEQKKFDLYKSSFALAIAIVLFIVLVSLLIIVWLLDGVDE